MFKKILILMVFICISRNSDCKDSTNIILIIVDDQGYADLSAMENSSLDCHTPNMDRIAQIGVLCTNAYTTAPVCSPSRAGMMTGLYQQRWDSLMYWTPGLPKNVPTLAEILRDNGYVTGKFGKSDFGANFHKTEVREFPTNHGFDEFLGFSAHAHDYFLLDEDIEKMTPDPYGWSESLGRLYRGDQKESFADSYTTELFTDEAISFIRSHKNGPFFLEISYNAVHHLIHEVPEKYLNKWGVRKIPNYSPSDGTYAQYYADYTQVDQITDEEMRKYYLANLNCLDDNIGRLLDEIESGGLTENTLIIFISDNGGEPLAGANNQPFSGSKYTMYEGGIRVPFIISWPNKLPQNEVYHHRVSALDIVPTCIEAAEIQTSDNHHLDGESLIGSIRNHKATKVSQKPLFFKFDKHYAVIQKDWKLVFTENYNPKDRPITSQIKLGKYDNQLALFNLKHDPGEQFNLINEKPRKARRLMRLYEKWVNDMVSGHKRYHPN